MTETMLVPLSCLDRTWLDQSSITIGYVLKSVDVPKVEAAARRLVEKWRLLAGRLEWSKELSIWCIRVPLQGDVSDRLKFTTTKLNKPLGSAPTSLGRDSADILVRPPLKYFRHPSTPSPAEAFASPKVPILSIHISEFTDCTCLGLSAPHVLFDGFGLGQVIRGLNAELNGTPWEVPPSFETNILQKALDKLAASHPFPEEGQEPEALLNVRRDVKQTSFSTALFLGLGIAYDYLWARAEMNAVFLGENVVSKLVQKVKNEVEESGAGWVSTGDILVAWILKAASQAGDATPVHVMSAFSTRAALERENPAVKNYTHNSILPCSMPSFTRQELASKSLAELASDYRRSIDAARNLSSLSAIYQLFNCSPTKPMPTWQRGTVSWTISNQAIGHFDEIDFGDEMLALWHWNVPIVPNNTVVLNKFKGGYIIQGVLDRARWKDVADVVKKMNAGADNVSPEP
ncbi:hypothetical protein H0H92_013155 [Tricholoma furcatifolium]|nr:hypothetical protein H0H92_013155 [Tricholoma furcatifolium]